MLDALDRSFMLLMALGRSLSQMLSPSSSCATPYEGCSHGGQNCFFCLFILFIQYASRKPPGLAVGSSCGWWTSSSGFGSGTPAGGPGQQFNAKPLDGAVFQRWERRTTRHGAGALNYKPYACYACCFVEGQLSSSGSRLSSECLPAARKCIFSNGKRIGITNPMLLVAS